MNLFEFIKSKLFLKHLAISIAGILVVLLAVFKYLDIYTLHEETIVVPDFNGLKVNKLDSFIAQKNLHYQIVDSVFYPKKEKGIVVKQDPIGGAEVKKDRTVYLYVTAVSPPKIKMPQLKDKSLRQAMATIESYGLKVGRSTYTPDQCNNCVLQQSIKNKIIEPGTMVEKGSVVNLLIGKGLSDEEIAVPDLTGLTRLEVKHLLMQLSLNEGSVHFDESADSLKATVYKQIPPSSSMAKLGSSIDLFFNNNSMNSSLADTTK